MLFYRKFISRKVFHEKSELQTSICNSLIMWVINKNQFSFAKRSIQKVYPCSFLSSLFMSLQRFYKVFKRIKVSWVGIDIEQVAVAVD